MNIKSLLSIVTVVAASFTALTGTAQAAAHYDSHGNVGYDTAAECDVAIQSGSAKFYQSFTHKPPLIRAGEKNVRVMTLKEVGSQYAQGACDLGVGKKLGRDGVSKALQGKYIPFSPDMEVNVYTDASGNAVRVSMKQCDNWFSGNAPRPVQLIKEAPQAIESTSPFSTEVATPAATATGAATGTSAAIFTGLAGVGAYAFGTVGAHSEKMHTNGKQPAWYKTGHLFNDKSITPTGQLGVGLQLTPYVGGEMYVEGGKNKSYTATSGVKQTVHRLAIGSRFTAGTSVDNPARVFVKAGVAAVHQDDFHPQFTVGVGGAYKLNNKMWLRADVDHYIKRSPHVYYDNMGFKKSYFAGVGLQYQFK